MSSERLTVQWMGVTCEDFNQFGFLGERYSSKVGRNEVHVMHTPIYLKGWISTRCYSNFIFNWSVTVRFGLRKTNKTPSGFYSMLFLSPVDNSWFCLCLYNPVKYSIWIWIWETEMLHIIRMLLTVCILKDLGNMKVYNWFRLIFTKVLQ